MRAAFRRLPVKDPLTGTRSVCETRSLGSGGPTAAAPWSRSSTGTAGWPDTRGDGDGVWVREDGLIVYDMGQRPLVRIIRSTPRLAPAGVVE